MTQEPQGAALAILAEESGGREYRLHPDRPIEGWAIRSGNQLWIWANGLRPLQVPPGGTPAVYEVWAALPRGQTLNLGPAGSGAGGSLLVTLPLPEHHQPAALLLTAQPAGAAHPAAVVLAGRLHPATPQLQVPGQPPQATHAAAPQGAEEPAPASPAAQVTAPIPAPEAGPAPPGVPPAPGAQAGAPEAPATAAQPESPEDSPATAAQPEGPEEPPATTAEPGGAADPPPAAAEPGSPTTLPEPAAAYSSGHLTGAELPIAGAGGPVLEATPPAGAEQGLDPATAAPPKPTTATSPDPATAAPPEPPAPSPPPGCEPLDHLTVNLEPTAPATPNSTGTAQLDFVRGALLLTLRGLPRPEQLGAAAQTGRPYNTYRAWLSSSATRELYSLGMAARVWTDTFRVQVRGGLPLRRYDTLLVSVEDRAGSGSRPSGPVLLSGRYRWYRVRT